MKKNILVALLLSVILFVGSKAFIVLFAFQTAEKLKQTVGQEVALTYAWISSELDGSIVFHDLSVTPYRLKRTFYIERLTLHYGNYFNLLLNLSNLSSGNHEGLQTLAADTIEGKLEGRDFEEWLALEYDEDFAKPLGLYACGDETRVNHNNLRLMGIQDYKASVLIHKAPSTETGTQGVSIALDRGALGSSKISASWKEFALPNNVSQWDISSFQLEDLTLTHVDNGYFRRLSNYCSAFFQLDRTQFSEKASIEWQQMLRSIGFDSGEGVRQLYRDYLLQGGQLTLALSPSTPFGVDSFKSLIGKDLVSFFKVSSRLNGVDMPLTQFTVNKAHFSPPVVKVVETVAEEEPPQSGYLPISLTALEQSVQQKVRLILLDGKKYEGVVVSLTDSKIELSQILAGGSVAYSLQRDQIGSIEVWH